MSGDTPTQAAERILLLATECYAAAHDVPVDWIDYEAGDPLGIEKIRVILTAAAAVPPAADAEPADVLPYCTQCKGNGTVVERTRRPLSVMAVECPRCNGSGYEPAPVRSGVDATDGGLREAAQAVVEAADGGTRSLSSALINLRAALAAGSWQ